MGKDEEIGETIHIMNETKRHSG